MTPADARRRFAAARVAHLATADAAGRPHLVPLVFAVSDDTVYSAVDHKPKRTTALRRLANIAENSAVSVLVNEYDDGDWDRLWWVRADGRAHAVDSSSPEGRRGVELLCGRYAQYADRTPDGAVLVVEVEHWSGWDPSDPR